MFNDNVISVLIGLIGACNNGGKTKNTDELILKSLSCFENVDEIIKKIKDEKDIISPGCKSCKSPCGNTSDYDINKIYNATNNIKQLKTKILDNLNELSTIMIDKNIKTDDNNMLIFYKSLSYISYDLNDRVLENLLNEIIKQKEVLIND